MDLNTNFSTITNNDTENSIIDKNINNQSLDHVVVTANSYDNLTSNNQSTMMDTDEDDNTKSILELFGG